MSNVWLYVAIYLLLGVAITIKFWDAMYNGAEKHYQTQLLQRGEKDDGKALTRKIIVAVVSPIVWPLFLIDLWHMSK